MESLGPLAERLCLSALEGPKKSDVKPDHKFCCSECPYSTHHKGHLDYHLLTHSGEQPHRCKFCDKAFSIKSNLTRHLQCHTGELTGKIGAFTDRKNLRDHINTHSGIQPHEFTDETLVEDEITLDCKVRSDLSALEGPKSHLEPNQKFRCSKCSYSTDHKGLLECHLLIHPVERPHVCELCGKTFVQLSRLKRHLLVHTGEKPYVCDTCGRGFSDISSRRKHEARMHCDKKNQTKSKNPEVTTPKKECHMKPGLKFRCTECPYSTNNKSTLERHLLTHSGERPHPCQHCSKRFLELAGLKRHLRLHTGERPHVCSTCGAAFRWQYTLTNHERTHPTENPLPCGVCGRQFKSSIAFKVHVCPRVQTAALRQPAPGKLPLETVCSVKKEKEGDKNTAG